MRAAIRWATARRNLLEALGNAESYMKAGKGGVKEIVNPCPPSITALLNELSDAEWALYNEVKDQIK